MGCISHDCKLDLVAIQGNLTGDQYIRDVLKPVVVHFDNHTLAARPVYMDDNARPHRARAVTAYLQSEDTPPNHYRAFTVRDSWLDVHWGIGCILVSPNPHLAIGYMKKKPALV
jgi:hypothetical protein